MPEQQSNQDSSLDSLWIVALIVGAVVLAWYFGKVYISSAVFYLRLYEIDAINFILKLFSELAKLVGISLPQAALGDWMLYIKQHVGSEVDFIKLVDLSRDVGEYLKYPLVLLLLVGAAWLYFSSPSQRFRHIYDTKLLKNLERKNWPQITPVVALDLVKEKIDQGAWAIALSPMNFCKKNSLLTVEEKQGKYSATLKRGAAYQALVLQLGARWSKPDSLPLHLKALFAIFAARINGDKKGSEFLLDQIANSAVGKKLDFSGVNELLHKHLAIA